MQLFQPPCFDLGERSVDELFERVAPPQLACVVEETERPLLTSIGGRGKQVLEPPHIEIAAIHDQAVAALVGDQQGARREGLA